MEREHSSEIKSNDQLLSIYIQAMLVPHQSLNEADTQQLIASITQIFQRTYGRRLITANENERTEISREVQDLARTAQILKNAA